MVGEVYIFVRLNLCSFHLMYLLTVFATQKGVVQKRLNGLN
jgi:hypothetical protein